MPHPNDRRLHRLRVEHNHQVERDERVFSNCEACETELNDDVETRTNNNGDEHCEDCYHEHYTDLNSCGNEVHSDVALRVNHGLLLIYISAPTRPYESSSAVSC